MTRRPSFLLISLLICACGAQPKPQTSPRAIDALRARAAAAPSDAELWTQLAIYEHLADGGDSERAAEALRKARALGAQSLRLRVTEAERLVLHGQPEQALQAYLDALRLAETSPDPLAQPIAEAVIGALKDMNDAVPGYRPRLREALQRALEHADALGLAASHAARMALLHDALAQGEPARADEHARAAGCLREARVAGAFGPREVLSYYQKLPPDVDKALKPRYPLGAGRPTVKTRRVRTRRCALSLGKGARRAYAGTTFAELDLQVESAGSYALRLETPNTLRATLDGEALLEVDLHRRPSEGVRYLPLTLKAGRHRLRLRVNSRHPNPSVLVALVPASGAQVQRAQLSRVARDGGPFEVYLASKLAVARGATVRARQQLAAAGAAPTAALLTLQAAVALADPLRPGNVRRDKARALLRRAAKQDPDAWYPAYALADLQAAEGRLNEAVKALRAAAARWPEVMAIHTALARRLTQRGWTEEADRVIAGLRRALPDACGPISLALEAARRRRQMARMKKLTDAAMGCDARSNARYRLLRRQRRSGEAAKELARLAALGDEQDAVQALDTQLELANLLGDRERQRALRQERAERWPDRPGPVLDAVDMALAAGDGGRAVDVLNKALAAHPDELHDLRRINRALGGADPFAGFRLDGLETVRAFEASGRRYDQPQVLVLDYTVVRVFEDGSSLDLTHNIIRVQSQEAVDDQGELSVPADARLLTARTIKADGRVLEPDVIRGKATLSLPNLAPGDYVEFEMVRAGSPSSGFPGGYLGQRFYFKSFEVPFDRSELVVIMPKAKRPLIDLRHDAPPTQRAVRGNLAIYRWRADQSRPLHAEPSSVPTREYFPSVNLGVDVHWADYVESLRDLLLDKDVYDPEIEGAVRELLADLEDAPASARAARLYRWVTDEIEPTDDVFGLSPAMWAARTGSRDRVLHYLLGLAGIDSELAIVRGLEADQTDSELPDPDIYAHVLLRVRTEDGVRWVHTGERGAPFGWLPSHLRGQPALVLNDQGEAARVRDGRPDEDLKRFSLEVKLARDGSAALHARETITGAGAVRWRSDLEEIPAADLEKRFEEAYASRMIPGAKLARLSVEGREDPEAPIVLDYTLHVERLGRRVGDLWKIPGLVPRSMAASYARTAARTSTLLVGPGIVQSTEITFVLPEGARVASAPEGAALQGVEGMRFESSVEVSKRRVRLTRQLRVPFTRVRPQDYPSFSAFCRAVDQAEAAELAVAF